MNLRNAVINEAVRRLDWRLLKFLKETTVIFRPEISRFGYEKAISRIFNKALEEGNNRVIQEIQAIYDGNIRTTGNVTYVDFKQAGQKKALVAPSECQAVVGAI